LPYIGHVPTKKIVRASISSNKKE